MEYSEKLQFHIIETPIITPSHGNFLRIELDTMSADF